jgi:small subunit ribosomal protein S16
MRLQRRGKKNYATYRVVVTERGAPVKGRSVADVGHYDPHTKVLVVAQDKVAAWLKQGVKPSATVHNLLIEHGIIQGKKVTSWKPKKKAGGSADVSAESVVPAEAVATPPVAPAPEVTE